MPPGSITFVGNAPYPPRRNDYTALHAAARQLLAQREQRYPDLVAKDAMTQPAADRGIRIMRAVVEQWRRVIAAEPLPDTPDYPRALGATWAEMQGELAAASARAAAIAARQPDHPASADQAELAAALAWHETPIAPDSGFSHIALAHDHAQWERRRDRRRAAA